MTCKKTITKTFVKGISTEDFPENRVGRLSKIHVGGTHELFLRVIQQIRLGG